MRYGLGVISRFAVVFLGSVVAGLSVFALEACSTDDAAPPDGADASEASTRDGSFVAEDAEVTCDPDADLTLRIEDASIADGASTTGICAACLTDRCSYELGHCAEDCKCQGIVGDALQCYLTTQNIACLGRLTDYLITNETRGRALQLAGCARTSCSPECAIDGGPEPNEGGSGDAAADSPAE